MADDANQTAPAPWHMDTPLCSAPATRALPLASPPAETANGTLHSHGANRFHTAGCCTISAQMNAALPGRIKGFVITFAEITGHVLVAKAIEAARLEAARANLARSRSLVAASRDVSQRMQALLLFQQLLQEAVEGDEPRQLLARLEQKLLTLSGLLGALTDTNRMEADGAETRIGIFPITDAPTPDRSAAIPTVLVPPRPRSVAYIVEDNPAIRATLKDLLESNALVVEDFASAEAFLEGYRPGTGGCLLLDAHLPGMSGLALLAALRRRGDHLPTILISGSHDVGLAVDAMRGGACDFLEKPVGRRDLMASIIRAIDGSHAIRLSDAAQEDAAARVAGLTARQHEILDLVLAGHPSKNIAADLGISQRTVENHRAAIMHKMHVKSLPELARKAQAAAAHPVRGQMLRESVALREPAVLRELARKPVLPLAVDARLPA